MLNFLKNDRILKKKIYYLVPVIIVLVFLLLPIKYSVSIKSKGKIYPEKSWTLSKGTDGRLLTSLSNYLTGISGGFSVKQFERGDAVQFRLNEKLSLKDKMNKGDTIGYVISNEIEKDIEKLKGELETAKAALTVKVSSEKESVIESEKKKLSFAEKELEEQTKIYNRKKKLFERDLISQEEFEADEARYELAKINISIAKERLRTVQSGAKEEEINFAKSQIASIENEIRVLQKRFESNNIISPINGLIDRPFSSDTLLVIHDTSKIVVMVPIKWSESNKVVVGQSVQISSSEVEQKINGRVYSISNKVYTIGNIQYIMATVVSDEKLRDLKLGLNVETEINTGDETALSIVLDFLKPIINF